MAEYDLSKTIVPFLDRHLSFPILAHLLETKLFADEQVQQAQYQLAKGTNMIDYTESLFKQIYPDQPVPPEFETNRNKAVAKNQQLEQDAQVVLNVIENPDVAQALRQDKNQNLQYLKDHFNLNLDQVAALYNFGQFQYSYGNYTGAADYLYHFRVLSTDPDLTLSAHWGKLACDILLGKWPAALEELDSLRELIDSRAPSAPSTSNSSSSSPALYQLHSRTWFIHWSLFVYFNHPEGRTLLLETFLSPTYLNTIQTSCPWIIRYLASAAILTRTSTTGRARHAVREIVKVIQTEEYQYSDPITNFLKQLYIEFDFGEAQKELGVAVNVVGNDFFLGEFKDEFLDNARYLISEAYCRIHQRIDIADLSDRLNLSKDEGEKWIVNLISETRMGAEAKIDLEKNVIEISRHPLPVYQSVIEKTRGLTLRTQAMGTAMARTLEVGSAATTAAPVPPVTSASTQVAVQ